MGRNVAVANVCYSKVVFAAAHTHTHTHTNTHTHTHTHTHTQLLWSTLANLCGATIRRRGQGTGQRFNQSSSNNPRDSRLVPFTAISDSDNIIELQ
jgi:hypothetical protein